MVRMTAKGTRGSRSEGMIQRGAATPFVHGCDPASVSDCWVCIWLGISLKVVLRAKPSGRNDGPLPQWPPCQPHSLLIPRVRAWQSIYGSTLAACSLAPSVHAFIGSGE